MPMASDTTRTRARQRHGEQGDVHVDKRTSRALVWPAFGRSDAFCVETETFDVGVGCNAGRTSGGGC